MENVDRVSEILEARCAELTVATLADGRRLIVHNVACGRDTAADFDHITTNISPAPSVPHTVDFFHANEIVQLECEDGNVLYRRFGAEF
jgi:hypothetical protein